MSERSKRLLLAASLALNVFFIGAAAGGGYMWFQSGQGLRAGQPLASAARYLTPDQRQAFRQALQAARRDSREDIQTGQASRALLAQLLDEPQIDRAAIDASLAATRAADIAARTRIETVIVDFAAKLNVADRAKLVDGLEERGQMLRGVRKN